MTTTAATLEVLINGKEVGVTDLLTRVRAQMQAAEAEAQRLQAAFAGLGKAPSGGGGGAPSNLPAAGGAQAAALTALQGPQQQTADGALKLAQAEARLAQAMGDPTRAATILKTALAQNVGASNQATLSVQAQIARLQSGANAFQQFGAAAKSSLLSILGPAALAAGAIKLIGETGELVKLGAAAQQTRARFDQLATTAHTTGDAMLASLRQASAGTINDTNLQLDAMKANLLGVATSADQLGPLLAIARDRAQQMGISTAFAFDSLVTGLGRGSRLILDNIGIMVKEGDVNAAYAKSVGKSVSALTDMEKKQALINEVLRQGNATLAQTGGAIDSNVAKLERLSANWDNLKAKVGGALANFIAPSVEGANAIATMGDRVQQVSGQTIAGATSFQNYGQRVQFVNTQLGQLNGLMGLLGLGTPKVQALSQAQFNFAQSLIKTGVSATEAEAKARSLNDAFITIGNVQAVIGRQGSLTTAQLDQLSNTILRLNQAGGEGAAQANALVTAFFNGQISAQQLAAALEQIAPSLAIQAQATQQAAVAAQVHSSSMDLEISGAVQTGLAIQAAAQATADAAAQSQIDAQAKAEEAAQTGLLTGQAQAAADAFIRLNPNVTASGAAAAAAAGGLNPLIAKLIEATLRANEARNALALFNALAGLKATAGAGAAASRQDLRDNQDVKGAGLRGTHDADTAAAVAAADAERRLQAAQGNQIPTIQRLRAEAEALRKTRGTSSADYINKLADIAEAEKRAAKGGGGGGGATKLTDQQKLNNTLLADQDRYQDQVEAQEKEHLKKVLSIEAEFAKKSLEQQKANEVSKRQSRADFYDSLTSATKDVGAKVTQELSGAYEAAYAKSQAIAQAGNQKLAADYLALKQRQIQQELDFQKATAKAKADGDKGEVARLAEIQKMRQETAAEEERQLLAGGDPNVKARDEAQTAEAQRFADQQGKNATAAERAADRKIAAADRSGKQIDAENLKLQEQERILNRIGAAPDGASAGGAPSTPSAPPAATTASPAADLTSIAAALSSIASQIAEAIDKSTGAITRAQGDTTSAVRGLSGRALA